MQYINQLMINIIPINRLWARSLGIFIYEAVFSCNLFSPSIRNEAMITLENDDVEMQHDELPSFQFLLNQ